jgi:predicted thioesterase
MKLLAVAATVFTLSTGAASAAIITTTDGQGRRITFDVRAKTVDTNWYADVLRATAHGNEISDVTIRIVPEPQIDALCGNEAAACYSGSRGTPTIIIPAGKSQHIEGTLIHEYGHHLDSSIRVPGVPELNGTPAWWAARGMAALLSNRTVAFDYSRGWDHSIGEIFAEDYAYIHVGPTYRYGIARWLTPPDEQLKAAMFAELGTPTAPLPAAPNTPLVINRNGTLTPRDIRTVPFGLLGPGRRVTFTATVARQQRKGTRARMQVVCNGSVAGTKNFTKGKRKLTLDIRNLGPGECDARLVSLTSSTLLKYNLRVQLAVEGEQTG